MSMFFGLNRSFDREIAPFAENSTLNEGLVGLWKLNEKDGTTAYDYSNNGEHGTYYGGTLQQPGVFGKCVKFAATSAEYVRLPNDNLNFEYNDAFSISAWIKVEEFRTQGIFFKCQDSGDYRGYGVWMESDGDITFRLRHDNNSRIYKRFNSGLTTAEWHLVVLTYDGSTKQNGVKLYLNGIEITLVIASVDVLGEDCTQNSINANIGARNDGNSMAFDGEISNVAVWAKELTKLEVNELIHPYLPETSFPAASTLNTGLVAHYKNDNKNINRLVDYSGNGHHGTINGVSYVRGVYSYALDFGNSSYIEIDDHDDFALGAGFSIAFRCANLFYGENPTVIGKGDATNSEFEVIITSTGQILVRIYNNNSSYYMQVRSAAASINSLGDWQQVVITYDGSSTSYGVQIYLDGIETLYDEHYSSLGVGMLNTTANLLIGTTYTKDTQFYGGILDDIQIWNKVLTTSEIAELQKPYPVFEHGSSLNNSLVFAGLFDETEGTTLFDYSGNALHGTRTGGSIDAEGKLLGEKAYVFDGTEGKIDIPNNALLDLTSNFSIACLFKASDIGGAQILLAKVMSESSHSNPYFAYSLHVLNGGGIATARAWVSIDNTGYTCEKTTSYDEWHIAIMTYDGATLKLYVDDLPESANSVPSGEINTTSTVLRIGSNGVGNEVLDGLVDKTFIWSKVLSSDERAEFAAFLNP